MDQLLSDGLMNMPGHQRVAQLENTQDLGRLYLLYKDMDAKVTSCI